MTRIRVIILMLTSLGAGVILGGYLFSDTQPRSFLALNRCEGTCLQANELLGLAASVGVQNFSALVPSVVKETDKTIVINHPGPQAPALLSNSQKGFEEHRRIFRCRWGIFA